MAKFMNVVRTTVKADCRDEFLKQHSEGLEFDGLASFSLTAIVLWVYGIQRII